MRRDPGNCADASTGAKGLRAAALIVGVATLVTLAMPGYSQVAGESKPVGPLHIFTPEEFLKLPDGLQAVFVGGLIEGMSFVTYGYSLPDHEAWTACVRRKSIGDTAADVVAYLQQNPGFNESIASAFAHVIGKRCKH